MEKRQLLTQNENNDGTNYLLIDGKVITNEDERRELSQPLMDHPEGRELFNNGILRIFKKRDALTVVSSYKDKDIIGRRIGYVYKMGEIEPKHRKDKAKLIGYVLQNLVSDSKVLNRTVDEGQFSKAFRGIEEKEAKKKRIGFVALGVAIIVILILLIIK